MDLPEITAQLSPMMRQYVETKRRHMDELLFYRLGDFYEMFFDDAITASRELELVLTARDCGLAERAPMCGVPWHSCDGYIARLIKKGYKVAICEQMEDPATAKGIVKRDIIRVVTPGTVTDNGMLSEDENNYICCMYFDVSSKGLCFIDISTGNVYVTEIAASIDSVIGEIDRFSPSEVIVNGRAAAQAKLIDYLQKGLDIRPYAPDEELFNLYECDAAVENLFDAKKRSCLDTLTSGTGVKALGGLLRYLSDTQFGGIDRIVDLKVYRCTDYMNLSASCRRNLELFANNRSGEKRGSLLWLMDHTVTPMGKRRLRAFLEEPLLDVNEINRRLDSVEELLNDSVRLLRINDILHDIHDIERMMTRVVYGSASPRELLSLASSCAALTTLREQMSVLRAPLSAELCGGIDELHDLCDEIEHVISPDAPALVRDGGYIRAGYNDEVDELRGIVNNTKEYLASLESNLREELGIKNLKIGYNRVFGYYLEVPRTFAGMIPDTFVRKQTLTTGERYINEELKNLESRIISSAEKVKHIEKNIYDGLLNFIENRIDRVQSTAYSVGVFDVLCNYARISAENGYKRPVVNDRDIISIKNGRHPVIEKVIEGGMFVPNDTLLDCGENLVDVITGPNMAGKSTYMRQIALIVIMAQAGCFVPANNTVIGVVDAIFTRVGASDNIFAGDSTFMVEMREVAEILNNATPKSLIILDEIGRGTSTYDGMSIARAVVEEICGSDGIGAKTLFATHYHELCVLEDEYSNVKNLNISVKKRGDDITFLRRIVKGAADESYGIEVAKLAGLPDRTIERAKDILSSITSSINSGTGEYHSVDRKDSAPNPAAAAVIDRLNKINPETLTPIEAMLALNELKHSAEDKNN